MRNCGSQEFWVGWRASQVGEAVAELLGEGTAPVLGTIETLFAEAPQVRQPVLGLVLLALAQCFCVFRRGWTCRLAWKASCTASLKAGSPR